jgi:predicted ATP-grasp superfamily ATP-dependent carboligase
VPDGPNLLIFGASTRAAAFSALRAGLRPWCADLFADADLEARCPVIRVPSDVYWRAFVELVGRELRGPWMYTGALENRPGTVRAMARVRPLWGNAFFPALALARSPNSWSSLLKRARLPCPAVRRTLFSAPPEGRWLLKSVLGAGGRHVFWLWDKRSRRGPGGLRYFQEYIEGDSCAALYVGDGKRARLLGVTWQLVGEPWLHARPFHYCGSIGPLPPEPALRQALERLGDVLAAGCGLRGIFGVDFILRDGTPWPVEINPRYTASVEVLEYAAGVPALALHRQVFDPTAPAPSIPPVKEGSFLGKAILFAREALTFPEDGPWMAVLREPRPVDAVPPFADIPNAGERIETGRPVLTFFTWGESPGACRDALQLIAADLDCRLFGR